MMRKNTNVIFAFVILLAVTLAVAAKPKTAKPKVQTARVEITERGYSLASIKLKRGIPARITFVRKTDATCAKEVVIEAYGINRKLPLNESVVIAFTPDKTGEFIFTCGMNMMRGKLIVK